MIRPVLSLGTALALAAILAPLPATAQGTVPAPTPPPSAPTASEPAAPAPSPTLNPADVTLPTVDLTDMQPAARQRVESMRDGILELLARDQPQAHDIGQVMGFYGQVLHALDRIDEAMEAYTQARALVPADPRWAYYLALARQGRGELEEAVTGYRTFLELAPQPLPAAHLRLGDALLQLGRLDEAQAAFRTAGELATPETAAQIGGAAFYGLGRIAAERGENEVAAELLRRALALQPTATVIHYPLAQAYRALEREELARYHLSLQGDREISFPDPLGVVLVGVEKGVALEVARDLAAADDFSETDFLGFVGAQIGNAAAGALEPMTGLIAESREAGTSPLVLARLQAALGSLQARAGDDEAATASFEAALAGDSSLVETRLRLGSSLARLGRFADALTSFDQVLAHRPAVSEATAAEARIQRGSVRANLGQLDEARADLEAAVVADPANAEAQLRLGSVLLAQGEEEAARAALGRAAEAATVPRLAAEAHTTLAEIFRRGGDAASAAASYARALDRDPRHTPAISGFASLLGQVGRYRDSATLYRRLQEEQPENRMARMGEVTALVLAGDDAAARQRMEQNLTRHPDDLNLRDVLARHLAAASDPAVRDGERAVQLATALYEEVPTPESMETLAMAHAQAGDFAAAVEWQQRLLETVAGQVDAENEVRMRANLERYRGRQSCCAEMGTGGS